MKRPSPEQLATALYITTEVRKLLARAELGLTNFPQALRELADRLEKSNVYRNPQE